MRMDKLGASQKKNKNASQMENQGASRWETFSTSQVENLGESQVKNSDASRADNLVEVRDLHVRFRTDEGMVYAVNGISFDVPRGKTMGLVGESGCGKSVSSNAIMRILPENGWIESGSIIYYGADGGTFDIAALDNEDPRVKLLRGRDIAMIFQEPMTSFCPVYTIGNQIIEAVTLHTDVPKSERRAYAIDLLRKVRITSPETRIDEYPYQLSGGMRQRAMIAMALASNPKMLIADEPTTSLDVTVQAQILSLLLELQAEMGMSILMINHNFGVIAETCDIVGVMYWGRIVEAAPTKPLLERPVHPYTRGLFKSIPQITDDRGVKLAYIKGTVPHAFHMIPGCPFYPRCPYGEDGLCNKVLPEEAAVSGDHRVSCHKWETIVGEYAGG